MPSPFPGMDPYLEARDLWQGVHAQLITYIQADLNPQLRPNYVAMVERRVYLAPADKQVVPDAVILEESPFPASLFPSERGGVAVAERVAPPEVAQPEHIILSEWEIRHPYIVIRDAHGREAVTVIEVLSPWNKMPGRGRVDYQDKQAEVLMSDANLVEIDLLRAGEHTIAAPASRMRPSDYRVCIHRVQKQSALDVFRLSLRNPLPNIGIPLRREEPDVVLHLQEVLTRCYNEGSYDLVVDYTKDPDPPLSPDDSTWADALMRESGSRPSAEVR